MADNRIAYGLAKKYGIDTAGMSPQEVWEALKEKGVTKESAEREYNQGVAAEREKLEKRYGRESNENSFEKNKQLNIQLFSAKLSDQTEKELKKSERSYLKQIKIHEEKIANPRKYITDYDERSPQYKEKIIVKWQKDIKEFE